MRRPRGVGASYRSGRADACPRCGAANGGEVATAGGTERTPGAPSVLVGACAGTLVSIVAAVVGLVISSRFPPVNSR